MDSQLRDLLDAAVGEPPHRVTPDAVRRRVRKRRLKEGAWAALAGADRRGPRRGRGRRTARHRPGRRQRLCRGCASLLRAGKLRRRGPGGPRHSDRGGDGHDQVPVAAVTGRGRRSRGHGQPGVLPGLREASAARSGYRSPGRGSTDSSSQIPAGSAGYSLVPGGQLGPQTVDAITASPDGAQVAVTVGPAVIGGRASVAGPDRGHQHPHRDPRGLARLGDTVSAPRSFPLFITDTIWCSSG